MKENNLEEIQYQIEKIQEEISKMYSLSYVICLATDDGDVPSYDLSGALYILNDKISEINQELDKIIRYINSIAEKKIK